MKLKAAWIILTIIILYGLLPVKIPVFFENYGNPNILKIHQYNLGCPGPNFVIEKGTVKISEDLKTKFPEFKDKIIEINISREQTFDNLISPEIREKGIWPSLIVKGEVVSVDTMYCDIYGSEYIPRFEVSDWSLVEYIPKMETFKPPVSLFYTGFIFFGIPVLLIISILKFLKKRKIL